MPEVREPSGLALAGAALAAPRTKLLPEAGARQGWAWALLLALRPLAVSPAMPPSPTSGLLECKFLTCPQTPSKWPHVPNPGPERLFPSLPTSLMSPATHRSHHKTCSPYPA